MIVSKPKIIGVIPAHLASVRFPRKILYPLAGLPMIEHVRRRAAMCTMLDEVYVATCDEEIAEVVSKGNGKVILTGNYHQNGTSRVAEAIQHLDASHIVLIQGDEPLILIRHIEALVSAMSTFSEADAWNATSEIASESELDRHSFVKCSVGDGNRINYCFRRSPSTAPYNQQVKYIRKILGLIGFTRNSLLALASMKASVVEENEYIEQMRIIENRKLLISVPVDVALSSINEPHEVSIVEEQLVNDPEQKKIFLGLTQS